jgi:hypothetical protein
VSKLVLRAYISRALPASPTKPRRLALPERCALQAAAIVTAVQAVPERFQ